jgi:hypothetical protein
VGLAAPLLQGCKKHKPDGCEGGRLRCPYCLILPCLGVLQKIANHLELIKGISSGLSVCVLLIHPPHPALPRRALDGVESPRARERSVPVSGLSVCVLLTCLPNSSYRIVAGSVSCHPSASCHEQERNGTPVRMDCV